MSVGFAVILKDMQYPIVSDIEIWIATFISPPPAEVPAGGRWSGHLDIKLLPDFSMLYKPVIPLPLAHHLRSLIEGTTSAGGGQRFGSVLRV